MSLFKKLIVIAHCYRLVSARILTFFFKIFRSLRSA